MISRCSRRRLVQTGPYAERSTQEQLSRRGWLKMTGLKMSPTSDWSGGRLPVSCTVPGQARPEVSDHVAMVNDL